MDILLGEFNTINDTQLIYLINCYQDYFTFKTNKEQTLLYLDSKMLKHYLDKGLEIKYRKYIFLFLRNNNSLSKNIEYKILNNKNIVLNNKNIVLNNKNIIFEKLNMNYNSNNSNNNSNNNKFNFENDNDMMNFQNITLKAYNIQLKHNRFSVKDKNIIKLYNNLYADIRLDRFYSKNVDKIFTYNGIIINYNNEVKNKILTLMSIEYLKSYKELDNNKTKKLYRKNLRLETKCNLILTNSKNINSWKKIITENLSSKICIISLKKNLKNILYKDINNYDYLLLNTELLNNQFYINYFKKYGSCTGIKNEKKNFSHLITNSLYENFFYKNINNDNIKNLFLFNWNNIIYDEIDLICVHDKYKFINNFYTDNTKYYLLYTFFNNSIANYVIENSIDLYKNKNIISNELKYDKLLDSDNFYFFVKNELLIDCNDKNKNNIKVNYNYLDISKDEFDLYNILYNGIKNNSNLSFFYINSYKYKFQYLDINNIIIVIQNYYENLIISEEKNIYNLEKYIHDIDRFNQIKNVICNKINSYKSKKSYIIDILNNYDNKEYYCTVCLENIDKNNFSIIQCGHYYCKNCIQKCIHENDDKYECPMCREKFNNTSIFVSNVIKETKKDINNNEIEILNTKLDKLKSLIYDVDKTNYIESNMSSTIIIVTNYKENVQTIKDYFKNELDTELYYHIIFTSLFYKNKSIQDKQKKQFNDIFVHKSSVRKILFTNYEYITNTNFNFISKIIFLDFNESNIDNYNMLKSDLKEKYLANNVILFHFLVAKDNYEEYIIKKFQ